MSAYLDALKAEYQTRIAELTDDLTQAKANVALDLWEAAATAELALAGRQLDSYSDVSASKNLRDAEEQRLLAEKYLAELEGILGEDGVTIYDQSHGTWR